MLASLQVKSNCKFTYWLLYKISEKLQGLFCKRFYKKKSMFICKKSSEPKDTWSGEIRKCEHGLGLWWKFSKFHGMQRNWLSIASLNSYQFNVTVHHPTKFWASIWNSYRVRVVTPSLRPGQILSCKISKFHGRPQKSAEHSHFNQWSAS